MFIQPNVSYGSLGKSVMPTTFRLGDTWLHENQLKCMTTSSNAWQPAQMHENQLNHHKQGLFGLKLCSQTMNFSPVGCNVKCQVLIVVFVGFGCQLGYMIYISRQLTGPSCTQIRQVLVIFFLAWTWLASPLKFNTVPLLLASRCQHQEVSWIK